MSHQYPQGYNPQLVQPVQPGVASPMVNPNGQYAQGQYQGAQMNPAQYQQGQYQQAPAGNGQPPRQQSTVIEVMRSNYTTIALFEVSGGYDPAQQYPKALCFVMGVPGVKDASKQSGRSYVQANKIVMKFSTQEVRSLGQSLINIATFKQAAANFVKHSDPSKNSYSQAGAAQAQAKKLEAKFDPARSNIIITMNYGQNNVMIPVPLQDAYGLGHDLINVGNFADAKLAEYKLAHKIGKEEIAGIDYDPAGTEEIHPAAQQAPAQQYQAPVQQYQAPVQQAPAQQQVAQQYSPEQIAYYQQLQAQQQMPGYPAGMPGAQ